MSNIQNFGISVLLILIICPITMLILQNMSRNALSSKLRQESNYRSDSFIRDASYYQYDEKGLLHSHLDSSLIIHFPYKNSSQFSDPHYFMYTNKHVLWNIKADSGKSQHGIQCIYLRNDVKIYELQQSIKPETTIVTNTLTLFPNYSFAKTNGPVTITQSNAVIQAIGMTANLKNGLVHLLSHSQGIYKVSQTREKALSQIRTREGRS